MLPESVPSDARSRSPLTVASANRQRTDARMTLFFLRRREKGQQLSAARLTADPHILHIRETRKVLDVALLTPVADICEFKGLVSMRASLSRGPCAHEQRQLPVLRTQPTIVSDMRNGPLSKGLTIRFMKGDRMWGLPGTPWRRERQGR